MSEYSSKWKTDAKCPKCKSVKFSVSEKFTSYNVYEADGGIVESYGVDDDGDVISTTCVCGKCGYRWHPRKSVFGQYIT